MNSEKDGPGVPLPAGRVRCFQADDSGALQFTGETSVPHTPVDEKRTLDVGYAFDLAGRAPAAGRAARERRASASTTSRSGCATASRSRSTIVVEEPIGGDTQLLTRRTLRCARIPGTLQFTLDVPAGKEVVLTYTARQRW